MVQRVTGGEITRKPTIEACLGLYGIYGLFWSDWPTALSSLVTSKQENRKELVIPDRCKIIWITVLQCFVTGKGVIKQVGKLQEQLWREKWVFLICFPVSVFSRHREGIFVLCVFMFSCVCVLKTQRMYICVVCVYDTSVCDPLGRNARGEEAPHWYRWLQTHFIICWRASNK